MCTATAVVAAFAATVSVPASAASRDVSASQWHSTVAKQVTAFEGRVPSGGSMTTTYKSVAPSMTRTWTQKQSASGAFSVRGTSQPRNEPSGWWELVCEDAAGTKCWRRSSQSPKWVKYGINETYPMSVSVAFRPGMPYSWDASYRIAHPTYTATGPARGEYTRIVFGQESVVMNANRDGARVTVKAVASSTPLTVKLPGKW